MKQWGPFKLEASHGHRGGHSESCEQQGRELDNVIPSWRFVDNRFHSKDRHQKGEGGWAPGISLFFPLSLTNMLFY
jgi:hypothetical protein